MDVKKDVVVMETGSDSRWKLPLRQYTNCKVPNRSDGVTVAHGILRVKRYKYRQKAEPQWPRGSLTFEVDLKSFAVCRQLFDYCFL